MRFVLLAALAASMWVCEAAAEVFVRWDRVVIGELPRGLGDNANAYTFDGLAAVKADFGTGPAAIYDVVAGDYVWVGAFSEPVDNLGQGWKRLANGDTFVFANNAAMYVVSGPEFEVTRIASDTRFVPRAINDSGHVAALQSHGLYKWPQNEQPISQGIDEVVGLTDQGLIAGSISAQIESGRSGLRPFRLSAENTLQVLNLGATPTDFEFTAPWMQAVAVTEAGLVYGVGAGNGPGSCGPSFGFEPSYEPCPPADGVPRWTWDGNTIATWEGLGERVNEHGAVVLWDSPVGPLLATQDGPPVSIGWQGYGGWTLESVNDQWQLLQIEIEGFFGASRAFLVRYDPIRIPGDYNATGIVEQGDLDLVLLGWGLNESSNLWLHDLPTGSVDQQELDRLLLNWGSSGGLAAASVPEPATWVLAAVAVGMAAIGFGRPR